MQQKMILSKDCRNFGDHGYKTIILIIILDLHENFRFSLIFCLFFQIIKKF